MKVPAHFSDITRSSTGSDGAASRNKIPGEQARTSKTSAFASLLEAGLKAVPVSMRYESPEALSVMELAALLRRHINGHFLSLLSRAPTDLSLSRGTITASVAASLRSEMSKNRLPAQEYGVSRNAGSDSVNRTIQEASRKYKVDENLVRAVIKAESDFQPRSTSPKGAKGLMQLMPGTARDMGVKDPYDPVDNIMCGVRYLRTLMDRYEGDIDRTLAAYNWGMGNLERSDGRLPGETRTYLSRVHRFYEEFNGSPYYTV